MKERGIFMRGESVRAILEGRKTMTRRIVKRQPIDCVPVGGAFAASWSEKTAEVYEHLHCPYGQPGDRLWVKETFQLCEWFGDHWEVASLKSEAQSIHKFYAADGASPNKEDIKWRPSIHMPRWASRLTLEITDVRVERLQDISEDDAKAEGVPDDGYAVHYYCDSGNPNDPEDFGQHRCNWRFGYKILWGEINGPGSWESNPWVWVISFKRVKP